MKASTRKEEYILVDVFMLFFFGKTGFKNSLTQNYT